MLTAKRLALLLLVINAIFFLWAESGRQTEPSVSPNGVIAPVERLVLLDELPRPPEPGLSAPDLQSGPEPSAESGPPVRATGTGAAPETSQEAGEQAGQQCYRIGPFANREAASEFASRQRVQDQIEAESFFEVKGYWIMYPPAETLAGGRRNLERLQAMGLQDLWLFEQGPWQGAISLGMYAEQSRAEALAKRLRERGLEVKVMPKRQTLTRYWVRLDRAIHAVWREEMPAGLVAMPCQVQSESGDSTSADPTVPEAAARQ